MLSLFSFALPLALAGSAIANPLMQRGDACLAAVTGSAALGDASLRKSHCSSFIKTIVTPAAKTVTVTITGTPSANNNGWNSWKRDVTVCPNEVPNYASACNEAGYKSACSAWGVAGETTFTIPAITTTKTIYLGNGNGGFGGQGGVCTSTKTNVITATTTVSACSGGTTTSTVMSTTTSVSTTVSTLTVGNAPSITFTTTTTTSVGTVTSTVTSTTTNVVGAGEIGTSTVTTTSTADLTTTATSTTTVTVGASTTATSTTTVTLATTMTTTDTTTVTDPGVTTTQTLAVTANNTVVVTSTVAGPDAATVTTTVTVGGTTGTTATPSTGNCLNAAQAQTFVDAFTDLLEYTSYNGTSAPPGRGYHYNVSATYLAVDFTDYSDSINWMAGYNLGSVTFPNRAAFDYGQGLLQPELKMTTLNVDFGCKTVHWRWSALTSSYAHVTGINYFTITDDLTQIQSNFAEFNNANWIQSFSVYNPSISCVVPGGLTAAQKRSLPHSY